MKTTLLTAPTGRLEIGRGWHGVGGSNGMRAPEGAERALRGEGYGKTEDESQHRHATCPD